VYFFSVFINNSVIIKLWRFKLSFTSTSSTSSTNKSPCQS